MIWIVRSKVILLAGGVLSMTAGSVAYGAFDEPVPPAPPTHAVADKQIVIVERHGGEGGQDYVRTITRDGKTFVFQTDRALSDEEVEQRIRAAETRILPAPRAPGGEHRVMKQRVIVLDDRGEHVTDVVTGEGDHCKGKDVVSDVNTSTQADGKLTRVRVQMCGMAGKIGQQAMAEAIDGIDKARDEIAQDKDLPDSTRNEVLKELDAELARLKRES